jgi:hypothetical protein
MDQGFGNGKKSESRSSCDEQPGSYFLELRNHFFRLKYLKIFDADPGSGSGMRKIRIRNPGWKKVGSGIGTTSRICNTVFKVHLHHFSKIKK